MKRVLLLCFLAISLLNGFTVSVANNGTVSQTPVVIIVTTSGDYGGGPRIPAQIPIQGMVMGNTIYLVFQCDLGDIDVELYKDGSGLVWQTSVDSSELSAMLPFNGSSGDYTLTFTMSGGAVYEGSFSIE